MKKKGGGLSVNHREFIDDLIDISGLSERDVKTVYDAMRLVLLRALGEGDKVVLQNVGVFKSRVQDKYYSRDAGTVCRDDVHFVVSFSASRNFSGAVNKGECVEKSIIDAMVRNREMVKRKEVL